MKNNFEETFGDTNKLGEIEFSFRLYSDYDVVEFNGYYYIVGKNHIKTETKILSGKDILISAIKLADILNQKGVFYSYSHKSFIGDTPEMSGLPIQIQERMRTPLKEFYADTIAVIILYWCNYYGLPFLEDGKANIFDDTALFYNMDLYGFQVDAFIKHLRWLHSCFYQWRYSEFDERPDWLKSNKRSKQSFEWYLSSITDSGIEYKVSYNEKRNRFDFYWSSEDLFKILNLQLALLATRKDPDGKQIKQCHKCNDWFEAKHGRQLYCEMQRGCNAKAVSQANWRANKEKSD